MTRNLDRRIELFFPVKDERIKGIGVLYTRKGIRLSTLIEGGAQERGKRAGTENDLWGLA